MKKLLFLCLATLVALCSFAQKGQEEFEKGMSFYQEENYTEAVSWYKKAAEQGHPGAQYGLGVCYYNGDGVSQDYEQAKYWWKRSAVQGQRQARYMLKILEFKGRLRKVNMNIVYFDFSTSLLLIYTLISAISELYLFALTNLPVFGFLNLYP